jgi:EAL domain-containing protein (putative c-di-GMP-specific phosphodiesterase class I)
LEVIAMQPVKVKRPRTNTLLIKESCDPLLKDLRKALGREEFQVHYQPRINAKTGKAVSMEALLRWKHSEKGWIFPADFIPLAEGSGLILGIGEWVLRSVCKQNKAWQNSGHPPLCVAVNLSVIQLQDPGIVDMISGILQETRLEAKWLELEVTEGCIIQNLEDIIGKLYQLKSLGIKITMDDFGTGQSSFTRLKQFPFDVLKIDQSFIRNITLDPVDAAIVSAVIDIGRKLKCKVIAEGVETLDQLKMVCGLGCEEIQGYWYSRPLPVKELERRWFKNLVVHK